MKISTDHAISLLNSGEVVAIPTETVYGLAASLRFPSAIKEIFRIKGRPQNNPLIVHLNAAEEISLYAKQLPEHFNELANAFWPGPLTLILPVKEETIPSIARAGLLTAGFRVPAQNLTREVISKTGPLVMPSANLSGRPSATSVAHVETDFGNDFSVVDGGNCEKGVESTILCWKESFWTIIRLGALAPEDFLSILGYLPTIHSEIEKEITPLCPGQLFRHYSPAAKLILLESFPGDINDPIVGFKDRHYPNNHRFFSLGSFKDPNEAIHELYSVLRRLDEEKIKQAYVDINFPNQGLWLTLKERLLKAAHG